MLRDRIDLENIKDLILTHSHSDHLYAEDLVARSPGFAQSAEHAIQIYGNDLSIHKCSQVLGAGSSKFNLHRVEPFQRTEMQTATIVPLPASHDPLETCLLYYIEKNGKTILYGHDSGWFPDRTWEWLHGKKLDLAILECTSGHRHSRSHMNVDAALRTKERFTDLGVLKPEGLIAVTHFSHNAHLLHEELTDLFAPHDMIVAYD
ncbi:MBL fold metallo-hydrolase [Paenibacillus cisolokensis]|nr:MBL fold metallo-hydrolase [Paenibacillus cisolokensis]